MLSAAKVKPKAEADNTYRDLEYSGYHKKTESNYCFIIQCFKENNEKRIMMKKRINEF